jgi:hypothetical protein
MFGRAPSWRRWDDNADAITELRRGSESQPRASHLRSATVTPPGGGGVKWPLLALVIAPGLAALWSIFARPRIGA